MTNNPKPANTAKRRKSRAKSPSNTVSSGRQTTKLDQLAALLARRDGATIEEMTSATGWQPHSVRGAIAGALKRRGLVITSEKMDGIRHYRSGTSR